MNGFTDEHINYTELWERIDTEHAQRLQEKGRMRKQLYKVDLRMSNNTKLPIVIATSYIERLPEIIRDNQKYYDRPDYHVEGWNLVDTSATLHLTDAQYEEELTYADINNEE